MHILFYSVFFLVLTLSVGLYVPKQFFDLETRWASMVPIVIRGHKMSATAHICDIYKVGGISEHESEPPCWLMLWLSRWTSMMPICLVSYDRRHELFYYVPHEWWFCLGWMCMGFDANLIKYVRPKYLSWHSLRNVITYHVKAFKHWIQCIWSIMPKWQMPSMFRG